ncbi:MAG TPA: glycosyltransferase [Thermoanaerobaculia bacterium]
MYIALVCPIALGHLNPMATLARELAGRGHRIGLVGSPRAKPFADEWGFELLTIAVPEYESGEFVNALDQLATLKGLAAMRLTARIFHRHTEVLLRDAPEAVRGAGAEAMIVDQVTLAGATIADALRLPFVVACDALAMNQEPQIPPAVLDWRYRSGFLGRLRNRLGARMFAASMRPIVRTISEFRGRHGLGPFGLEDINEAGLAQVAQQPAFFDYPRAALPPHFHYTGPWHEPTRVSESTAFPWEKLDGRPLVYASLGTMQNRLQPVFRAILDACAELPVQVVLSLGNAEATWDGPVPANAIVVGFAPQLSLLDRASLLITHAGLNTVLEGLSRGLPMLCMPLANDQPGVARRVEWLGAGEVLKPGGASKERIRALLEKLLTEDYRQAAQRCRRQLEGSRGAVRAADIVEEAFTSRRRVDRRVPSTNP